MAVSPYDQAAWSTYTPLSSQEILSPALMMRDREDRLNEEYATLNDDVQKIAFIAEHENDPAVKQMYSNYASQLEQGMDTLANRGVTPNSRRQLLGVRSMYQSQIAPIKVGYEMKLQDINNYNQTKAKDPTWIGVDPSQRTVSDYMNNGLQPFAQQGMSGALITKMANDYLSPFSQEMLDEPQLRDLLTTVVGEEKIPQYMDYIKKYGYKPGTEGHNKLIEAVKGKILGATGISSWASPEQVAQASGYIDLASSATIGKEQSQVINNSAYTVAAQKQAAAEAAAAAKEIASGTLENATNYGNRMETIESVNKVPGATKAILSKNQSNLTSYDNSGNIIIDPSKIESKDIPELDKFNVNANKEIADFYRDELKRVSEIPYVGNIVTNYGPDSKLGRQMMAYDNTKKRFEHKLREEAAVKIRKDIQSSIKTMRENYPELAEVSEKDVVALSKVLEESSNFATNVKISAADKSLNIDSYGDTTLKIHESNGALWNNPQATFYDDRGNEIKINRKIKKYLEDSKNTISTLALSTSNSKGSPEIIYKLSDGYTMGLPVTEDNKKLFSNYKHITTSIAAHDFSQGVIKKLELPTPTVVKYNTGEGEVSVNIVKLKNLRPDFRGGYIAEGLDAKGNLYPFFNVVDNSLYDNIIPAFQHQIFEENKSAGTFKE